MKDQITSIKIFIRYKHYLILDNKFKDVDDCFSNSMDTFKSNLLKYPGLAGSVGYGKNIRPDVMAWIVLQWKDAGDHEKEFPDVFVLVDFLKNHPLVAKALGFRVF
jgi:hypothetical protein